jgi:hypothetical protein
MKRLNFLKSAIIIASTVFVLSSCGDKEEPNESPFNQIVNADETTGKSGVTFVTSGAWTSTITEGTTKSTKSGTASWISIDPEHGDTAGEYTITISLQKNYTGEDRKATITISFDDMDITITVTQKGTGTSANTDSGISYPETGKFGYNILAEEFVEAKKTEWGRYEYSVRAKLPDDKLKLKIVIKPVNPSYYVCRNRIDSERGSLCDAKFLEFHEICPECGGVNTLHKYFSDGIGFNQGSDFNWLVSNVINEFTFTYVNELVHKEGNVADASVIFGGDCIVEYYENGAKEPTKVKKIKVID